VTFERKVVRAIPLPQNLTKNAPVTLTVRGSASGTGTSVAFNGMFYSDTRFILTQTPDAFRPRDGRDSAANCTTPDSQGLTHDGDCHPRYKVQLATGPVSPQDLAVLEFRRPQSLMWAGLPPSVAILNRISTRVKPRMNLGGLGSAWAIAPPPTPTLAASYTFELSLPSSLSGRKWLKGTSSNRGTDTENDPDYIFEPDRNTTLAPPAAGGLTIATKADTTDPVYVTVSSRDFGGVAQLRATGTMGTLDRQTFDAEILDQAAANVVPPLNNPITGGMCGADFARHPFASLPVDQDCNGIADSWEAKFVGPGHNLCPYCDDEARGAGAATTALYKGDGYSAFDEYRGFHVAGTGNTPIAWTPTDPTKQDLFYWDAAKVTAPNNADLWPHLPVIFGRETGSFMLLHRVRGDQAQARDPGDPTQGVQALNKNSPFTPRGFAIVYVIDNKLSAGTLGNSGLDSDPANSFRNTGKLPIRIGYKAIQDEAKQIRQTNASVYASVILEQVLAHETGHKLGREHRERTASQIAFDKNNIKNLTIGQFMQDPKNFDNPKAKQTTIYVAETVYELTTAAGFQQRQTEEQEQVLAASTKGGGPQAEIPNLTFSQTAFNGPSKPPQWPFQIQINYTKTVDQLRLLSQDGTIMCHTPRLDQVNSTDWRFAPDDLSGLCLTSGGCGKCQSGVCK
jgi:hypothetical protein